MSDSRGSLYIDGNALFRAIDDMNEQAFKWLDLWRLGSALVGDSMHLNRVVFAFGVTGADRTEVQMERTYLRALAARKVDCLVDDPVREFHECSRCGHGWDERRARHNATDLAIEILNDAWQDKFEEAWLITDTLSDGSLAKKLGDLPNKSLTLVCLRNIPRQLRDNTHLRRKALTKRHLRAASLEEQVATPDGDAVRRPRAWSPRPSAVWNDLEITGL